MNRSIVVQVDYQKREKNFKKTQKAHKRIMVHDAENRAKVGSQVIIQEGRPISKKKSFSLIDIKGEK